MRIPTTQILTASNAAVPQQAARNHTAATGADAAADARMLNALTERPAESQQTGDRDAQEQYIAGDPNQRKKQSGPDSNDSSSPETAPSSIWSLSVADDTPRSDLDLRG